MKRTFLISFLLLLTVAEVGAVTLTLDECLEMAARENRGLKGTEMDVVAMGEQSRMARAALFPSLRMKASYSLVDRAGRLIIDRGTFAADLPPEKVEVSTSDRDFYFLNLILDQPLFTGGRLLHAVRKSEAAHLESRLRSERERETLIFQVRKNYYDALNARLRREVSQKVLEAKKERLRVLEELHREGYAPREDLLRQEADLALAELDLSVSRNGEDMALSRLARLIYLPQGTPLSVTGSAQGFSVVAPLQEVIDYALGNGKELKMTQARIQGADEDITMARGGYYPQASIQGNYFRQKETNITRPDLWMVGLTLDWAIFEWGKTSADVRQKTAMKQRLEYLREEQRQRVALEAEKAWRDAREKEQEVMAREKRVKSFESMVKIAADRYAEGAVKLVDLLEAEAQLQREFSDYMTALNDLNSAIASLHLATSGAPAAWFVPKGVYVPKIECSTPVKPVPTGGVPSATTTTGDPLNEEPVPARPDRGDSDRSTVMSRFDLPGGLEREINEVLVGELDETVAGNF